VREALELVEARLEAGEAADALLAFVAGVQVTIPQDELQAASRRAMLVLAAGGDPHRELELDSRAVQVLARDLDSPERRESLQQALGSLEDAAADLPLTSALRGRLEDDPELAWSAFALALLADELGDE
jgi:HEAT repeat protein